jgi:S-adenosylmethionine:diacylglycerol 3-amino-3-carboxypropyl transferase
MKKIGRDKEFFKYNKGNLPAMLKGQFENCIYNNLNKDNPYFQYIAFNKFKCNLPYLDEQSFEIIKSRVDRIKIKKIQFEDQIKSGEKFDLLYISDIFEYMSQEKTDQLTPYIYNSLNECGQVLFFNMMNTRRLYGDFLEELVDQRYNRTFYYKAFYSYIKKNSND